MHASTRDGVIVGAPALTDEGMGWLAHSHRKVAFGGTWRHDADVHSCWDDRYSFGGMTVGHRPPEATRANRYEFAWGTPWVALMAELTPAWREVYGQILGFWADRCLEYWALHEWVENRGPDPNRDRYPEELKANVPPGLWGKYDLQPWAANGVEPFEYDPDPVRANGSCNVMYKGYLNIVLSLYNYITGDARYDEPFKVRYSDDLQFEYDHRSLNELIAQQWIANPHGIACEVQKIFPICNTLTGAGVRLYDVMHGTDFSASFEHFKYHQQRHYMGNGAGEGPIAWLTDFYDPQHDWNLRLDKAQESLGMPWFATAWYGAGLDPELYRRVYDGGVATYLASAEDGATWLAPPGRATGGGAAVGPQAVVEEDQAHFHIAPGMGSAAVCAQEYGDDEACEALRTTMLEHYRPTWDDTRGEFYFRFGSDSEWPPGGYNGWVMPSLLGAKAGQWSRIFLDPDVDRHSQPTVEGVDFPALRVRQAYYDAEDAALYASFTTFDEAAAGSPTTFEVSGLKPGRRYRVMVDGDESEVLQPVDRSLTIDTTIADHTLVVRDVE